MRILSSANASSGKNGAFSWQTHFFLDASLLSAKV
jgi:hypothetical protein